MVQRLDPLANDPLASAPPAFSDEAARQALDVGFGLTGSITALAGERDQNFRVDTADGQRFLFKISNPADTLPILDMQTAALRHIEQVAPDLPVMRTLPGVSGEAWTEVPGPDGRTYPVRLFTFLPGRVTPNALLTTALQVSGIIDFGDMTHAALVCDLAVSISDVLHGRDDAVAAAEVMIDGYTSVTPLDDEEAGLLADLVAARLATEITVTAWRRGLYPGNAAYSASGEPGARDFLDRIEAAGPGTVTARFREACRGLPYRSAPRGL